MLLLLPFQGYFNVLSVIIVFVSFVSSNLAFLLTIKTMSLVLPFQGYDNGLSVIIVFVSFVSPSHT